MTARAIELPLTKAVAATLRAGELLHLSGPLFTARDAAHKRLIEGLERGDPPPFPLENAVIYYVGPAPAREGRVIGPAGPTTSGRLDPYTPPLLGRGVSGLIGKGTRSDEVKAALRRHGAVYLAAVGGAAALLSQQIVSSRVIAYEELGPEAVRELVVVAFPVIVVNDSHGGDAYEEGRRQFARPRE